MKNYEEMLNERLEKVPEKSKNDERFEVPKPMVSIQGNRTFISNFEEICNKLRRDKKFVAKYLFKELAIPGHVDKTRLVLQGKASSSLIEKKLDNFVKDFVMCSECKRPDTRLEKVNRMTMLVCEACGSKQHVKKM